MRIFTQNLYYFGVIQNLINRRHSKISPNIYIRNLMYGVNYKDVFKINYLHYL